MAKINWFKSLWLNSEERALLKQALEDKETLSTTSVTHTTTDRDGNIREEAYSTKPYKNIFYSNKVVTVVMTSGLVLTKQNVDKDFVQKIAGAQTEEFIFNLMQDIQDKPISQAVETQEEKDLVRANLSSFEGEADFVIKGEEVFLKGINLALPAVVASTFIEIIEKAKLSDFDSDKEELEDEYNALKMFWCKLALNPLYQSREDLLLFVKVNDVRITPNGNLVLYRRIVKVGEGDNSLGVFVSQQYYAKKKQKKSPKNYFVYKVQSRPEYVIRSSKLRGKRQRGYILEGNLDKLYKTLPEMEDNIYTSWHNKGENQIKIGQVYSIPESKINLDNGLCAAGGLHAAAVDYNYSGFGDTPVVVLVNPSRAITVPRGETGKLRTTEMFIACVNDKPLGQHFDDDNLSALDEEYHDYTLAELEKALKDRSFDKLTVKDNLPAIPIADIANIRDLLSKRIVTV